MPDRVAAGAARRVLVGVPLPVRLRTHWYLLFVVAAAAVLGIVFTGRFNSPPPPQPILPAAVPAATVRLDVTPWANLKEVRNASTGNVLNVSGQTPLEFSLPPGLYRLVLSHPKFDDMLVPIRVDAGAETVIRRSFPTFDPEQVLKAYE